MKNQAIFLNDRKYMVKLYNIIGTGLWIADAWELVDGGMLDCGFSTITFVDHQLYGRIGTNPDKAKYAHLPPYSKDRSDACMAAFNEIYEQAYKLIFEAFPELRAMGHKRSMGEVMVSKKED